MKKYINISNIEIFVNFFLILIFLYIYYFSLNHIINLWTYSEIHLNYSAGFIRRGFLGEVLIIASKIGISKKIFFSTIFFLFSIINLIIFTKIIRNLTNNIWLFLFISLNPSLILFSFYDLGGYARFEIFGISIILLHTIFIQNLINNKKKLKKYTIFYFLIIFPLLIISILIHEINSVISLFHFFSAIIILKIYKSEIKYYFLFLVPWIFILFISYYFLTSNISKEQLVIIYNGIEDKENILIWVWESIINSTRERFSEFQYMSNPISNLFYYFFIFLFYFLPIFFIFKKNNVTYYNLFISLIVCAPLFFLFIIGRDWGRWIHLIILLFFCYNSAFFKGKLQTKYFTKLNLNLRIVIVAIILFQLLSTRIPHCCNIVEKNIHLIGGLPQKIFVFYKLTTNQFDIEKRFRSF
jgi:hypothetical protein